MGPLMRAVLIMITILLITNISPFNTLILNPNWLTKSLKPWIESKPGIKSTINDANNKHISTQWKSTQNMSVYFNLSSVPKQCLDPNVSENDTKHYQEIQHIFRTIRNTKPVDKTLKQSRQRTSQLAHILTEFESAITIKSITNRCFHTQIITMDD